MKERQVPTRIICWNKTTHHTSRRNLLGERKWAEQREPPSSCPNHSFGQCLSNSGSPLKISAIDWGDICSWCGLTNQKKAQNQHSPTIEMLFFCLSRYFCWVFLSSSSPPLIDNRMASGYRPSLRHRSTAPSKLPTRSAWLISPSVSWSQGDKLQLDFQAWQTMTSCYKCWSHNRWRGFTTWYRDLKVGIFIRGLAKEVWGRNRTWGSSICNFFSSLEVE